MGATPAQEIWEAALGELQVQVTRSYYRTWLEKTTGLSYEDNQFVVGVPNAFVAEYLNQNQRSLIEKTLIGLTRPDVKVGFRVGSAKETTAKGPVARPAGEARYTFDSFVVSDNNRLAYAAAMAAAENPGQGYNPLFLYGGVGLGKTHLLHSIYHAARANKFHALYVSAEQFTNEFVSAIRERNTDDFRGKFRNVDILLIDDIQFISGKEQTEESFFHTFNELHNANRQIVMTSDCPPKAMPRLGARLCSRFEWGLVADIKPPDFDARVSILEAKAEQEKTEVPREVLEFIAQRIEQNIRELEGSLHRAIAYARLFRALLTPELAARALEDIAARSSRSAPVTPESVIDAVAKNFQLDPEDLKGRQRDRNTTLARQMAMYLIKEATGCSLAQIGLEFGKRDHSTVTHATRKIAEGVASDPYLKRKLHEIELDLRQR
ncbi:MAG: chromosomal replication initiator protein DnaA [Dehalococcoidia bacterium]|jgi:chromosomal replication initiator protein